MENLIEQIESKIINSNTHNNLSKDGLISIDLNKDMSIDSKCLNPPHRSNMVDLSSMKFNEILHVIKTNKRLLCDYFKFELYKTLVKDQVMQLVKQTQIPYKCMKHFLQFIFSFQGVSEIVIELLAKNDSCLTEEHMFIIINHSFKFKKASSIIENVINRNIDIGYMMDLIALNKSYKLGIDVLTLILKVIKKKGTNSNSKEWLMLIRNMITILVIQKEISQNEYNIIIEDINSLSLIFRSEDNSYDNNKVNEMLNDNWDIELYNKLHNKKGVIVETIPI